MDGSHATSGSRAANAVFAATVLLLGNARRGSSFQVVYFGFKQSYLVYLPTDGWINTKEV